MRCEECTEFDASYIPSRCDHPTNVVLLDEGGMYNKREALDINPNGDCNMGCKKESKLDF